MRNAILIAATAASLAMVPATAEARYYGGYGYSNGYYPQPSYNNGYYGNGGYYGQGAYGNGYYGNGYGYDGYYGNGYYRCKSGTGGAIVGGAAGALIGREIERSNNRYSYRRHSGTTGAIIGGVIGALAGREVTRTCR